MVDRPATTSTKITVASGQTFNNGLVPTAAGNATKIFDCDSALTDTSISGAYIDEIWFQYSRQRIGSSPTIDAQTEETSKAYAANSTSCVITAGHNFKIGDEVYINFTTWSSGSVPADGLFTITAITPTTFTVTIPSQGSITGVCSYYLPVPFCIYLVNTGTVSSTEDYFPLLQFTIPATSNNITYSLTEKKVLPYINHPTVQAGTNFTSANNEVAPKQRGLMLKRGQALYASVGGSVALTYPFYVNVQGGYY